MAESATMGMELEEELVDTEEDNRDENARTIFLAELNLIQIISFLSLSSEELDFEAVEINENAKAHQEHKAVSDLRSRKRGGIKKYKNIEPEIQSFSTKIRDCRHSRRM
ncbi:uncharacterized protein [Nicotiana tomentosiformis]|uniref:uncharacterized protein n=1 Tax=Nicotiana tomentosiformis TaxID=4098 RepID=UPI00051BC062|nr:uncharacterized protein LOC104103776 [Nicotiana tomentosiformis]XP_009610012.1 uncharacterized protein LOC104103776 [Nicotiana tomentosiformis]XP_018628788.1 uncharacterized protein LOC104103776 [Nicotiana tomentosiformis]XP_018628792.1 uncharacterized protein LOC104103776 [Nicotiana tomentosiformis]